MSLSKGKRPIRERLWNEQGGKCYYCGVITKLPKAGMKGNGGAGKRLATLDHIIPVSLGGAFAPTKNCVVACAGCNVERGTKDARLVILEKQGAL